MYEHPGAGRRPPTAAQQQANWRYAEGPRVPSGLFPGGPVRPTYREPYPVRGMAVAAGLFGGAAWLLVFGLLARDLRGYAWWTVAAGAVAWLVALLLGRQGDRGVATGLGIAVALAVSIVATAVAVRWAVTATWPLW